MLIINAVGLQIRQSNSIVSFGKFVKFVKFVVEYRRQVVQFVVYTRLLFVRICNPHVWNIGICNPAMTLVAHYKCL